MRILGYVGDHKKDSVLARLGWGLVRLAQVGEKYQRVTHCEWLIGGDWRDALIAGASLRDGGVRMKRTDLTSGNWIVLDVPAWSDEEAMRRLKPEVGAGYDSRGAVATILWFITHSLAEWFCSELLAHLAGLFDAHRYKPATLFALAVSLPGTRDITHEVFKQET